MRFIKFSVLSILTIGLIYLLDNSQKIGDASIPPLGKFFSPFHGFWQNAETKSDFQDQILDLGIFEQPVRVVYDDRLVPHIFAQSISDAMIAQGYVTAKHRLWQMDISTRATGGRLSEVLGEELLPRDQLQRRKGLSYAAENAVKGWQKNPTNFALVESYCTGVNAYINSLQPEDYPIEFKLLGYAPEAWTPLHTALFSKAMAQSLCMREEDLEASNSLAHFGRNTFDFLYPEYNPKQSPIVPDEVNYDFQPVPVPTKSAKDDQQFGYIPHTPFQKPPPFIGSNNWAVAPQKTKNGHAIMCSDPHLGLTLPAIWYEVQLHAPNLNVYGVSIPGMPGVIMGFNENNAWGMTNVGRDVVDWYRIRWKDAGKTHYIYDNEVKTVENRIEQYVLKNGTTVSDTIKYTIWGPIVYESEEHPKQDMAMRWIGHDESHPDEMAVFLQLNQSKNFEDYTKALENYDAPAQNVAFASKNGDIAIRPSGKFPLKREGQGRMVQDGSKSTNAWSGFIPKAHNAFVKNPSSGFVGSANQRTSNKTYPYYYNGGFDDFRGRYLHDKLENMDNITVKDMMQLQNDNFSLEAAELLPLLLQSLDRNDLTKEQRGILLTLEDWDYRFEANKIAPTFYVLWSKAFYKKTWDEIYDFDDATLLKPELWRTIDLFANAPDNKFFDIVGTNENETAKGVAVLAFEEMTEQLEERTNKQQSLKWVDYKDTRISHIGRIPAFTYNNVPIGGFHHALNAVQTGFGPSWRMVVELGEQVEAFGVYPGGQSGNPGSRFYSDMVLDWAKGDYHPLLFANSPEAIVARHLYEEELR